MTIEMTACPRCGHWLEAGWLNAGNGPLRWNKGKPDRSIFGGELLLSRPLVWGWVRTGALRCSACHLVLFESDPNARNVAFFGSRT